MKYIKIQWLHNTKMDPTLLLSELDDDRYEIRKIEVFLDGRIGFASDMESSGGTFLGEKPIPELEEIALDSQFVPLACNANVFEQAWQLAKSGKRWMGP